jgi:hypothetical protein
MMSSASKRALWPFILKIFADAGYQGARAALAAARVGSWVLEIVSVLCDQSGSDYKNVILIGLNSAFTLRLGREYGDTTDSISTRGSWPLSPRVRSGSKIRSFAHAPLGDAA